MFKDYGDFHSMFVDIAPVGSRVTCDPPPADTDEDFICLAPQDVSEKLIAMGFKQDGSPQFYTGNDNGEFRSWRRGDTNLIVTPQSEFYELFLTATHLAKKFNLMDKQERIALFQAILYGVKYDNLAA